MKEKPLILLVDDNPDNLQVLGKYLREDYATAVSLNGREALDFAGKMTPDLILLDIMMPVMDGFEACKKLKARPETRDTPIIFLTARKDIETVVEGFELGAVDYITKPFHKAELLARVNTHYRLKEKEAERLKVQKLEAVSTLAGGIAHQFNNKLFAITGNLDMARENGQHNADMLKYLTAIGQSAEEMRRLTAQLLAYAQGGKYHVKTLSFNQLMSNTLEYFHQNKNDTQIHIQTHFETNLPLVKADAIQMQMVFDGVISNAVEAIHKEGVIQVQTKTQKVENSALENNLTGKAAACACVEITDNGEGMKPETLARVFEPFFTTKFQGRGMGMAAAYGIVKNHRGYIQVRSQFGQGTSVTIGLPILENNDVK